MQRLILHSDLNCFYAAVECLYDRSLKGKPVAVCGDPNKRHGIVLAKSYEAKAFGIHTGETVWQAKQKCPELILVPVHFERYKKYSKLVRDIYYEYTNFVEPYGLDEAYLNISKPDGDFNYALETARKINREIKEKLGLTVSIGVSFTKSFAKLGSDYKKPDGITVITPDNFKDIVWPLDVDILMYVGNATRNKLEKLGITTIGMLANADERGIAENFGRNGLKARNRALGRDFEPVQDYVYKRKIKSVGNSVTLPYDIYEESDVDITLMVLAESVAHRLRENGARCNTIQIEIKEDVYYKASAQKKLRYATNVSDDIFRTAKKLFESRHTYGRPVRSIGIKVCELDFGETVQLSLDPEFKRSETQLKIDNMVEAVRNKYGYESIKRGIMLLNNELSEINPCADHTVYPGGFVQ